MSEPATQSDGAIPREEVSETLANILKRAEFDSEPSLLEEALRWLSDRLKPEGDADFAFLLAKYVLLGLSALLVALLIFLLARAIARRIVGRRGAEHDDARAAVRSRVAELRALASAASAAGDRSLAIRYLICALVVGLGQRGNLHYRDAWTNRELLERGRPTKEMRAILTPVIEEFEAKEFGNEPASAGDVARLEELCRRWLGGTDEGEASR